MQLLVLELASLRDTLEDSATTREDSKPDKNPSPSF